MIWKIILIIFVVTFGLIFFLRRQKKEENSLSAIKVKGLLKSELGWVEIANSQMKPILRGKIFKNYQDTIYMGYGIVISENIEPIFLKDLHDLSPIVVDGKLLIKFGIDANSPLVLGKVKDSTDKKILENIIDSQKPLETARAIFATDYLTLFKEKENIPQFDTFWQKSKRL